ncbi:glutaminase A [Negadavirga shengliensis]|uniref:glutaminase n=1 Tax=Negadavirga shengliensis TaxID=1389218 RepID=A0ABV9SYH3_9BACT
MKKHRIEDFETFCQDIKKYYERSRSKNEGEVKGGGKADSYAIAICNMEGETYSLGDHHERFALQSVSKPINYALALKENGEEEVHRHVGREPSGRGYNGLVLNQESLPHNPMINAGAIMTCSMIKPGETMENRFSHVKETWSNLCANSDIGFDSSVANGKDKGYQRNMALSYHMLEQGAFPEGTDIYETMELYNKCCGIRLNVDQLAVAAASLASGGCCPATREKVFESENIRDCLSLMLSCGMYDYSGEFAFLVGLPAKSGVSGAMMVAVPGLLGIGIYSPPLDELGNPVRGIAFCRELVKEYGFHKYDLIVKNTS